MKRWNILFAAVLIFLSLSGCHRDTAVRLETEVSPPDQLYQLELTGDYTPENQLEPKYRTGDPVAIVLGHITEHEFIVTVNGKELERDDDASDMTYEVYSFVMPAEDVRVVIAGISVDIPTEPVPTETTPPPEVTQPEPEDDDFVSVKDYIPDIVVDLRYFTENNFTGQPIYSFADAWLRYGTVKKLMQVQEELKENGLYLKIWDGFRPPSAQFRLWEICPDPAYVSNPNKGFSSHSRGNTVDITMVYSDGTEAVMPTLFDDFSKLADRDYSDCSEEAAANARFLEDLMVQYGFKPYSGEWWHYTDTQSYPVEQVFDPMVPMRFYADCSEYISLRVRPDTAADVITRIPAGAQFEVTARYGDFAFVRYHHLTGYVLFSYIQPVG